MFAFVCKSVSTSICVSLWVCIRAFMRASVFIDIANGFSAGPKFVCSVTQYCSRFIRQAFGIEAWLMTVSDTTVNDLTPVSGDRREGGREGKREREEIRGRIVMIDRPSRQDDILTWRVGKENLEWNKKAGKWKNTQSNNGRVPLTRFSQTLALKIRLRFRRRRIKIFHICLKLTLTNTHTYAHMHTCAHTHTHTNTH